ncbi:FAD-dependent monooxygenase [Amycolatopsis rubida]|uniref:FAD-dependent monooxygenase n=1 Tax=Amycolatopsis rubida TaxID=112413 RepID=A0ABX0C0T7_9PSEU|nr:MULTISPECIES: FAD-dependent monooxygenase [Amycolatopsis]MYW90517.1 FAD-dependent monooxygenase [Amycolatopsis rubida]MYW95115.1 FAD-dependent monooxygenase [Amycolatopsis rubida]NEC55497.1 FAD-dependent monooxygenase [Amycolatopsis rubida]NEC60102.1 FAD-dependent monooxygenase [Amycolatopsis rubida]OAP24987.1 FAD-dependent urate hydroxylase [Amycolatopsis sp. M39]
MTTAMIIGGGIAGPVTAMALQKAGIDSAVYEAYPTSADGVGAFLSIMHNGLDALTAIDAADLVREHSFPASTVEFFNHRGTRLGQAPIGGATGDRGPRMIKRSTLYRALRDEASRRGIPVHHGKHLTNATTTPEGTVTAEFADGTDAAGTLLIGADGIHSATRGLIDPAAPTPRYTGAITVCGYTAQSPVTTEPGTFRMIYGRKAFFAFLTAPNGQSWWFANLPSPHAEFTKEQLASTTSDEWKQRVVELLARDRTPAADIVRASDDTVTGANGYDIATTPTWHTDTTIIIGDAAHVSAPNAGHGASMAIEDSIVLAQCLRDLPAPQAFRAYEAIRRPRVERVVATSARMGGNATPGPVKRMIRDAILPRKLKKGPRNTASWLTDHHIDWNQTITRADGIASASELS